MADAVINELLAELARQNIRLAVVDGQLLARGPAGAMTADLAGRVRQHKAALVLALTTRPAAPVAQPSLFDAPTIEPKAPSAPVEPQNRAAPVEVPVGWPSDIPLPTWWPEFLAIKGGIELLAARRSACPACGFGVAIQWRTPGLAEPLWSCPACCATAPDAMPAANRLAEQPAAQQPAELIEWRYPTTPRPGFRVKPRACGWCGPDTTWWQDSNNRWHCGQCEHEK